MVNNRTSLGSVVVRLGHEKDGYLPPRKLKVEVQVDSGKRVLDDIGQVKIDGKPIEPDEMEEYSNFDCSATSQRKGLSSRTCRCFRIKI